MINRLVSLTALLCVAGVVLIDKLIPDSPLFFFASSSQWITLARLVLVGAMIWLSFKSPITDLKIQRYVWQAGLWLMGIGAGIMLASQINGVLFDYFKPLDLLLLIEAGVVFSLVSLETASQTQPATKKLKSKTYSKSSRQPA